MLGVTSEYYNTGLNNLESEFCFTQFVRIFLSVQVKVRNPSLISFFLSGFLL